MGEMNIENALSAIQDLGFSPDSAEITVIYSPDGDPGKRRGLKGVWFDYSILKFSTRKASSINICVDDEECKITAIF